MNAGVLSPLELRKLTLDLPQLLLLLLLLTVVRECNRAAEEVEVSAQSSNGEKRDYDEDCDDAIGQSGIPSTTSSTRARSTARANTCYATGNVLVSVPPVPSVIVLRCGKEVG